MGIYSLTNPLDGHDKLEKNASEDGRVVSPYTDPLATRVDSWREPDTQSTPQQSNLVKLLSNRGPCSPDNPPEKTEETSAPWEFSTYSNNLPLSDYRATRLHLIGRRAADLYFDVLELERSLSSGQMWM